jgi:hypothetical protein
MSSDLAFSTTDWEGYCLQVTTHPDGSATLSTYRPRATSTRYEVALSDEQVTDLQLALAAGLHAARQVPDGR